MNSNEDKHEEIPFYSSTGVHINWLPEPPPKTGLAKIWDNITFWWRYSDIANGIKDALCWIILITAYFTICGVLYLAHLGLGRFTGWW